MKHYEETFATWNQIAQTYEEKFMDLDIYNASYEYFLRRLPQGSSVLDIGCGPGNISRFLLLKRPDLSLLGIDVAPNMVQLARKNNPSGRFEIMDCRDARHIPEKFDGIICGFCIPYLSDDDTSGLIRQAAELLVAGGILYLSFVNGDPAGSGFQSGSSGHRTYFHYHRMQDIMDHLEKAGFMLAAHFEISYTHSQNKKELHTVLIAGKENDV